MSLNPAALAAPSRSGARPGARPGLAAPALAVLLVIAALLPNPSKGGSLTGEIAKSDFRTWSTNHGGAWLNFNQFLSGTLIRDQWASRLGVTFATTHDADSAPLDAGVPVIASAGYAYNLGRITIVGTRPRSTLDDKYSAYEIRFAQPQRWAGIHRYWSGPTLTRFLGPTGEILHEFQGEGFQAWLSDSNDTNTWVSRIEIDGEERNGQRQVGHSDDLIFGTQPIPRSLPYLSIRGASPSLAEGGAGATPRVRVDYRLQRGIGTNEWFLSTDPIAGATNGLAPAARGIYLEPD